MLYYKTKILIISAGTIGTAKLLLSSKENLPNLSMEVGKNISFNGSVKSIAMLPDWCPDADMYSSRSHPRLVSYHFANKEHIMVTAAKVLPVQFVSSARFDTPELGLPHWGEEYTGFIKKIRRRMIILAALGIEPTIASMTVSVNGHMNLHLNKNKASKDHYYHLLDVLNSIFEKSGCKRMRFNYIDRKGKKQPTPFYSSLHQLGSWRMYDHIGSGVVNVNGEVFYYPGM